MKTRLNKAASPNRRPRSPFAMSGNFDYCFCAPPSLSAAVGEPQRSAAPPLKVGLRTIKTERKNVNKLLHALVLVFFTGACWFLALMLKLPLMVQAATSRLP